MRTYSGGLLANKVCILRISQEFVINFIGENV